MKRLIDYRIGTRLVLVISLVVITVVGGFLFFLKNRMTYLAENNAARIAESVVGEYLWMIKTDADSAMMASEFLAHTAEGFLLEEGTVFSREDADRILRKTLEESPLLSRAYFLFEPDQFDGRDKEFRNRGIHDETGRYISCFTRNTQGKILHRAMDQYGSADYYQQPKRRNTAFATDPFEHNLDGEKRLMISLVHPIQNARGDFIGIAGCDVSVETLDTNITMVKTFENTGFLTVLAPEGTILAGGGGGLAGTNINDLEGVPPEYLSGIFSGEDFLFETYDEFKKESFLVYGSHFMVRETGYQLTVSNHIPSRIIYKETRRVVSLILTLGFFALGLIMLVVYFFSRQLTRQLGIGVRFAEEISQGNLAARIEINQKDEIGQLASALSSMAVKLRQVVSGVQTASNNVHTGSRQISTTSQQMSQGASEQASSTEEVSASIQQMTSNIEQNSDNSLMTEKIARKAAQDATEGGTAVNEAVSAMKQIAEKINIIDEIARNTNLLALNAAIEAARAGEAGKGFAVVASEVRKLAERSQSAATEITSLSKNSMQVAENAGSLLNRIVPDIQHTAELIQGISAASTEQNSGAQQINSAILQLDKVVQTNASSSEELASMSEELSSQAEKLAEIMSFFKMAQQGSPSMRPPVQQIAQETAPVRITAPEPLKITVKDEEFMEF